MAAGGKHSHAVRQHMGALRKQNSPSQGGNEFRVLSHEGTRSRCSDEMLCVLISSRYHGRLRPLQARRSIAEPIPFSELMGKRSRGTRARSSLTNQNAAGLGPGTREGPLRIVGSNTCRPQAVPGGLGKGGDIYLQIHAAIETKCGQNRRECCKSRVVGACSRRFFFSMTIHSREPIGGTAGAKGFISFYIYLYVYLCI